MVNAYNIYLFPKRHRTNTNLTRQRHAIYHFFNTNNATKPVLSMSPNFFYKNSVLKNGSGRSNKEKRNRMLKLVGGKPRRLYTILAGTINSRNQNRTRNFNNPGVKMAHLGQLAFYHRLFSAAFPKFPSARPRNVRLTRVKLPANRVPNAELNLMLKKYYNQVTLGNPTSNINNSTGEPYRRYNGLKKRFNVNSRIANYYRRTGPNN